MSRYHGGSGSRSPGRSPRGSYYGGRYGRYGPGYGYGGGFYGGAGLATGLILGTALGGAYAAPYRSDTVIIQQPQQPILVPASYSQIPAIQAANPNLNVQFIPAHQPVYYQQPTLQAPIYQPTVLNPYATYGTSPVILSPRY